MWVLIKSCFFFAGLESISGGSAQSTVRMSNSKNGSLGYAPDLTSGVHISNEYTYSDKNSNSSNYKGITGMSTPIPLAPFSDFRPISEHFYEQPMVPMQQHKMKNSPDSNERAPFLPEQRSSCSSSGTIIFKAQNESWNYSFFS